MKKINFGFINKIFYRNRYLAIFSLILAVIIWVAVVMKFSPETTYDIKDVKVTVDLKGTAAEAMGLKAFGADDFKVDITVKGPRYSIRAAGISAEDFSVSASAADVTSAGEYSLPLKATVLNKNASYEVDRLSSDSINVYFDNFTSEKVINLELTGVPENIVNDGLYCEGPVLTPSSVTVSGATSQLNLLGDKIEIPFNQLQSGKFPLTKTLSYEADIKLETSEGRELKYININEGSKVKVSFPVLGTKILESTVDFKNAPSSATSDISNIEYSVSPFSTQVAAATDVLSSMTKLTVGAVDFRDIPLGESTFTFDPLDISSAKVIDTTADKFVVTVKTKDDVTEKQIDIPSSLVQVTGAPGGFVISPVANDICISGAKVIGPALSLDTLGASDISVIVDFSDISNLTAGRREVDATVKVNLSGCWVYGRYKILMQVNKL